MLLSKAEKNMSLWGKTFSLIFDTWSGTVGIFSSLGTLVEGEGHPEGLEKPEPCPPARRAED